MGDLNLGEIQYKTNDYQIYTPSPLDWIVRDWSHIEHVYHLSWLFLLEVIFHLADHYTLSYCIPHHSS